MHLPTVVTTLQQDGSFPQACGASEALAQQICFRLSSAKQLGVDALDTPAKLTRDVPILVAALDVLTLVVVLFTLGKTQL